MQIGTLNPGFESRWQVKTAAGSVKVTASRCGDQNLTLHLNLMSYLNKIKLNGRSKQRGVTDDDSHTPINRLLLCVRHDVGKSEGQGGRAAGGQHPGAVDSDAFCGWVVLQQSKSLLNVIPKEESFKS